MDKYLELIVIALMVVFGSACAPKVNGPTACTVTPVTSPVAGSLITCPDGSQNLVPDGVNGTNGTNGTNGAAGTNGTNGTQITIVQLCPNLPATSYPSNFPEQAFCISSNLYGVYWTGSEAFLAELPPGDYSSTSPQGCNLQILANCVTEQL